MSIIILLQQRAHLLVIPIPFIKENVKLSEMLSQLGFFCSVQFNCGRGLTWCRK